MALCPKLISSKFLVIYIVHQIIKVGFVIWVIFFHLKTSATKFILNVTTLLASSKVKVNSLSLLVLLLINKFKSNAQRTHRNQFALFICLICLKKMRFLRIIAYVIVPLIAILAYFQYECMRSKECHYDSYDPELTDSIDALPFRQKGTVRQDHYGFFDFIVAPILPCAVKMLSMAIFPT